MTKRELLLKKIKENNGIITTKEALNIGIYKDILKELTIKEEPTLPSALGNGKYGKVSDQSRRAGTKIVKGESLTVVIPIKRTSAPTPRPTSTPGTGA